MTDLTTSVIRPGRALRVAVCAAAVSLMLGAPVLQAEDAGQFDTGWYGGLGLGSGDLDPDGGTSGWGVSDGSDDGWRVFVGRHLTPRVRVELNYTDLGAASLLHSNPAINIAVPDAHVDYSAFGVNADWLVRPADSRWNLFARGGVAAIDNDASDAAIQIDRDDDVSLAVGAGAQWRGNGRWLAQVVYERLSSDAEWLGVSVGAYLGGRHRGVDAEPAAATNTTATATERTPALISSPAAPEPDYSCRVVRRVIKGLDFASESAELDADAHALLDRVGAALGRIPDLIVEVVGHTDSWGSADYNQGLSERRAQAVADYLSGLPGFMTTLSVRGAGEAEPVADNATAEGRALNRRIELLLDNRLVCQN
ncbi:MAG: OmpA family protein [Pseudomonadota bacterium]